MELEQLDTSSEEIEEEFKNIKYEFLEVDSILNVLSFGSHVGKTYSDFGCVTFFINLDKAKDFISKGSFGDIEVLKGVPYTITLPMKTQKKSGLAVGFTHTGVCPICGKVFETKRNFSQIYCSTACRRIGEKQKNKIKYPLPSNTVLRGLLLKWESESVGSGVKNEAI